jgi:hypothetical protein
MQGRSPGIRVGASRAIRALFRDIRHHHLFHADQAVLHAGRRGLGAPTVAYEGCDCRHG